MKKFLFVAILAAGSLVACNDTSTTVTPEDSARMADSAAKANQTPSTMGSDSMGTTTPMMGDSSKMMSDSGSTMMSDSSHK